MGMFEMTPEQVDEWREKYRELVRPHVDEEVIAAAGFRHGGAATRMAISKAQLGAIAYAGSKLFSKKKAGGLPERVMLVVTPTKLYAFDYGFKGRRHKIKEEVAVWDRAGLHISTEQKGGMTALTISSPGEGEKATLVGAGVKDDPLSQELIGVLQGAAPATA
jgi:hypothetical protein